ncbi:adhesion G-protein coupled receptor G2-like isoform X1 [Simochromis diagramma]|uniref:adhesion G-protein coupled receptor G2-like isoform X1 n=1 Tax=Simochromis diagramma TaxID=43689 RepID=UPI001A7EE3CF|nr:adhesion G-protein coupled receptor G2-like isoform X1 [Simochromis diagramma]
MQRMKWWLLSWLVFFLSQQTSTDSPPKTPCNTTQHENSGGQGSCKDRCQNKDDSCCCMNYVDDILETGSLEDTINAIEELEDFIEKAEINGSDLAMTSDHVVALQYEPNDMFNGFNIHASDKNISYEPLPSSTLGVQLPTELSPGSNNTIVILKLKWPETNRRILGSQYEVYDRALVGLSVEGKNISGLHQRVNITINLTKKINETQKPSCHFFNFTTRNFSENGCITLWTRGQNNVTCSCDHLTYFAVLMVPASPSPKDQEILTYISLTGCSLSLFTLVITVLLFITNRKVREDVSMKVHINLVIALILLNLHFLLSSTVAAVSSTGVCLYMALALHCSLLATFFWMALEGFHLYLLLVRVFNIYIKRYLLKISVVGWGVPVVIVSVVVIINRGFYGLVSLDTSNPNKRAICYITNNTVNMGTTVGLFSLVFLFNMFMFGATIRCVWVLRKSTEFGQSNRDRAKKDICTLLGVMTLLGITWGLVFFSFGHLTIVGLYLFCILNSLQGFFIFLWFMMSMRKAKTSVTKTSNENHSNNT